MNKAERRLGGAAFRLLNRVKKEANMEDILTRLLNDTGFNESMIEIKPVAKVKPPIIFSIKSSPRSERKYIQLDIARDFAEKIGWNDSQTSFKISAAFTGVHWLIAASASGENTGKWSAKCLRFTTPVLDTFHKSLSTIGLYKYLNGKLAFEVV